MTKCISLIAGLLLFTFVASATDEGPRFETFLGYTSIRTDLQSTNLVGDHLSDTFFMNGGSGQLIYNFNKWFSAVVDGGAVHKGNLSVFNLDDTKAFFLAGPRVSFKRSSRWSPYVQVLFGGAKRDVSKSLTVETSSTPPIVTPYGNLFPPPGVNITASVSASQTDFSMTAGGGLDVKVSKRFAFRPFAIDYMLTTFPSIINGNGNHQNGLRLSAGILFRLGGE